MATGPFQKALGVGGSLGVLVWILMSPTCYRHTVKGEKRLPHRNCLVVPDLSVTLRGRLMRLNTFSLYESDVRTCVSTS